MPIIGGVNQPSTAQIMDVDGTLKAGAVDVTAVLADNIVTLEKLSGVVRDMLRQPYMYSVLEPPADFAAFGWTPLTIYQEADGRPHLGGVSLLNFAPTGAGTWYVDITRPDNNGNGLSLATAEKGINYAVQDANASADGGTIWVADGVYPYPHGQITLPLTKNVAVRAINPGKVVFSNHREFTFAPDAILTNTYVVAHGFSGGTSHYDVRDAKYPNARGDYQQLVKRASAAEVNSNPGSWYDDGTNLYVRLSDSRAPDAFVRPYWTGSGSASASIKDNAPTVLFEGIRFEGGSSCVTVQATSAAVSPVVYFVSCAFKYAYGDSLNNVGADTYCENCLAACSYSGDGFHYAEKSGQRQARGFEFNCIGRHNGDNADHIDNGSTAHNNSVVIRLAGNYYETYGRPIQDVGGGASWNVGCWAHDSLDAVNDIAIACGTSGAGNTQKMWLDHCRTSGCAYDLEVYPNCAAYVRNCAFGTGASVNNGTIANY